MDSKTFQKARKIRAILVDVDGVLTDGGIIYDNAANEMKRFNVKDGLIVAHLQRFGIKVGAITGRLSEVVKRRCDELNFDFQAHGIGIKLDEYERFKQLSRLFDSQIAYIGDDINDLPVLTRCGLAACPSDAREYIQQRVDLVLPSTGGNGVLRDLADIVLDSQGKLGDIIMDFTGESNE